MDRNRQQTFIISTIREKLYIFLWFNLLTCFPLIKMVAMFFVDSPNHWTFLMIIWLHYFYKGWSLYLLTKNWATTFCRQRNHMITKKTFLIVPCLSNVRFRYRHVNENSELVISRTGICIRQLIELPTAIRFMLISLVLRAHFDKRSSHLNFTRVCKKTRSWFTV